MSNSSERRWTGRWYESGDEHAILGLRNRVYITKNLERARIETWYWQFRDNPAGAGIIRLAVDGDIMAGQYAVIPTRFSVRGVETPAALSCDTMVSPDYQRQGIFTTLAKDVYDRTEDMGIHLVWGFPNENSHHGFTTKLQWFDIAGLPTYVRPLRLAPPFQYVLKNRAAGAVAGALASLAQPFLFAVKKKAPDTRGGLSIGKVARADAGFDELWQRNKDRFGVMQVRDAAYLNWRYFGQEPDISYDLFAVRRDGALIGFIVLRRNIFFGVSTGVVADLFPADMPADVLDFALDYVASHSLNNGCALMVMLCTALPRDAYRRNHFFKVPDKISPKTFHFGARCEGPAELAVTARDFSNWYLTWGDTDLI